MTATPESKTAPQWKWVALGSIFWALVCGYLGFEAGYSRGIRENAPVIEGGRYQFVQTSMGIMRGDTQSGDLARYSNAYKTWVVETGPDKGSAAPTP